MVELNNKSNFAINIKNLSHNYKFIKALDNISINIKKGSTIGIVGPDGVGKSTLLSLISGVKKLQKGDINVLGYNVKKQSHRDLLCHEMSFMPQGLGKNLYFSLSVWENIEFIANLFSLQKDEKIKHIEKLLRTTNLLKFKDREAGKLSGGMKQKLSLCCALIHNPKLLILDEPTTGVDPLSRRTFWKLIQSVKENYPEMTIIVATAYIEEASQFEYLLAMDNGKIIANDLTKNVLLLTKSKNIEEAYIKLLPNNKKTFINFNIPIFEPIKNSQPVIEAYNLTKKFGDFIAVNNVSFTIEKGEIFGFLGSNGCGKSTTMKMLTGLLNPSSGKAKVFGKDIIDTNKIQNKINIGYMSQSFSLYEEITVTENLILHANLYSIPKKDIKKIVDESLKEFELTNVASMTPKSLPMGIRQRLQLAASCLHKPLLLILDEPTSGVDPVARDMFWQHLIKLSRKDRVTIFISTHFMNEAERCDRISFMNAGNVLAIGTPNELQNQFNTTSLEEAFIKYLEKEELSDQNDRNSNNDNEFLQNKSTSSYKKNSHYKNILIFAKRETKELLKDKLRLLFAIFGPIALMLTTVFCVSFDLDNVNFSVLDLDKSNKSAEFIQYYARNNLFHEKETVNNIKDIFQNIKSSKIIVGISIPPDFEKDLLQNKSPHVAFYINGSEPFNSKVIRQYILAIQQEYLNDYIRYYINSPKISKVPEYVEPKLMFNQEFKSIFVMTPGVIMITLLLIPTLLTALCIVREKEKGSIINFYLSPTNKLDFLIGKQTPYIILSFISGLLLIALSVILLKVPIKGSFIGLLIGVFLYSLSSTSLGLLFSCFAKTQVDSLIISSIICLIVSSNFSGLIYPVSTLEGISFWIGTLFPASWFQLISLGTFIKGLKIINLIPMYSYLLIFYSGYLFCSYYLLKKQEI